jgi:hypothetical protein
VVAEITFASCHRHIIRRLPEDKFQEFLNGTPPVSVTPGWHRTKKEIVIQGLEAPGIGETFRLYDSYLGKMEKALAARCSAWPRCGSKRVRVSPTGSSALPGIVVQAPLPRRRRARGAQAGCRFSSTALVHTRISARSDFNGSCEQTNQTPAALLFMEADQGGARHLVANSALQLEPA